MMPLQGLYVVNIQTDTSLTLQNQHQTTLDGAVVSAVYLLCNSLINKVINRQPHVRHDAPLLHPTNSSDQVL